MDVEIIGLKFAWDNEDGFGEVTFYNDIEGEWKIDAETMSRDFCKRMLSNFVDNFKDEDFNKKSVKKYLHNLVDKSEIV